MPHLYCCFQVVDPTGSLSCAPAHLFGLIWDGDAAAAADDAVEYDCHVELGVGWRSGKNGEHMLGLFSPVSHGCYYQHYHCWLSHLHCAQ